MDCVRVLADKHRVVTQDDRQQQRVPQAGDGIVVATTQQIPVMFHGWGKNRGKKEKKLRGAKSRTLSEGSRFRDTQKNQKKTVIANSAIEPIRALSPWTGSWQAFRIDD